MLERLLTSPVDLASLEAVAKLAHHEAAVLERVAEIDRALGALQVGFHHVKVLGHVVFAGLEPVAVFAMQLATEVAALQRGPEAVLVEAELTPPADLAKQLAAMAQLLRRAQVAWVSAAAVFSDDSIASALPELAAQHAELAATW